MNCKQFNAIKLEEILVSLGQLPTKQNEKEAWYLNPFGTESQASFKLDKRNNVWYLHSEGIGGNNIDFMKKYLIASVKEILEWAEKQNFSSFQPQNNIHPKNSKPNYQITEIKELHNENLKHYLHQRGLSQVIYPLIKEIHFNMNGKTLYAIGFENLSGGWELRNPFYKGSLLKKDISLIHLPTISESRNQNQTGKSIAVFEGFIDALSFVEMKPFFKGNLLVMNSISLLNRTKEYLKIYPEIHLFLDNDKAGETCKNEILKSFPEAKDHSEIYSPHKDFNDYLLFQNKTETEIENKNQREQQQNLKKQQQENNARHNTYRIKR